MPQTGWHANSIHNALANKVPEATYHKEAKKCYLAILRKEGGRGFKNTAWLVTAASL